LDWYKLLFDERPKTTKRDLYDMERQLANFVSAIRQGDPMILIVGLRRTGKTSLSSKLDWLRPSFLG
jgi:predicted AAA+ superfamily ATPase